MANGIENMTIQNLWMSLHQTLSDISHSNIISDPPPRVITIKPKINKSDLIKLKKFWHNKGNPKQNKKKTQEWEIITNEVTNKGLISKIYKHCLQLNTEKTKNPVKKWGDLNRQFPKEDIQMAKKHMKDVQHHSLLEKCKSKLL